MRINYPMVVRLGGSLLLVGGFWLTADVAHGAPIHPEGKATIVSTVPSVSSLRLLGYGLFLVHIGLKPFQSNRLTDLKLGDRPVVPEPALQSQS
jgi:hypothetical protein